MSLISTELIARVACMKKRPSEEKLLALQHALEVNALRPSDPCCMYRSCYHHFSSHGKSWKNPDGKKKSCRCKHQRT